MSGIYYFAYGSNLDRQQIRRCCPGALFVGAAFLEGHRLVFVGCSKKWTGGVASLAAGAGAVAPGALYELSSEDLERLDDFEGVPNVYRRERRLVLDAWGRSFEAQVYFKLDTAPNPPGPEYYRVIRRAYEELGFDLQRLWDAAQEGTGAG